jgi:hypothetical protein
MPVSKAVPNWLSVENKLSVTVQAEVYWLHGAILANLTRLLPVFWWI